MDKDKALTCRGSSSSSSGGGGGGSCGGGGGGEMAARNCAEKTRSMIGGRRRLG